MKKQKHLSLRISEDTLQKFHYVCDYEGRSANSQLLIYIRDAIKAYEAAHGEIMLEEKEGGGPQ